MHRCLLVAAEQNESKATKTVFMNYTSNFDDHQAFNGEHVQTNLRVWYLFYIRMHPIGSRFIRCVAQMIAQMLTQMMLGMVSPKLSPKSSPKLSPKFSMHFYNEYDNFRDPDPVRKMVQSGPILSLLGTFSGAFGRPFGRHPQPFGRHCKHLLKYESIHIYHFGVWFPVRW